MSKALNALFLAALGALASCAITLRLSQPVVKPVVPASLSSIDVLALPVKPGLVPVEPPRVAERAAPPHVPLPPRKVIRK